VRERFGWAELVASDENLGFGRAVNLVASRTDSDWVAPANADIAVRPGAIETLLDGGGRDPGAGAIAPRLIAPGGDTQHSVFAFPTIPYSLALALGVYRVVPGLGDRLAIPGHWDAERPRRVPWAVAALLLVRRAAWDAVGGFDDRHWMYAEDLDLGWRLREAGWATRYEPRALVDHEGAAATAQVFGADPSPHWQRATWGFIVRRWGVGHVWAVALLNFVGAVLRWLLVALRSIDQPQASARRRQELAQWALVQLRGLRGRRALERIS
jgi:N-acetylglucosaminyl-diphospho-decaprenol L-rhamnosyltransferase